MEREILFPLQDVFRAERDLKGGSSKRGTCGRKGRGCQFTGKIALR